jgi:hypothetical protein
MWIHTVREAASKSYFEYNMPRINISHYLAHNRSLEEVVAEGHLNLNSLLLVANAN